jgi:hypothetical protein
MNRREQTRGTCAYCGKPMTRSGMARHLASCTGREAAIRTAEAAGKSATRLIHLEVRDAYDPRYWLQLEMTGDAPLKKLDDYLRAIWLECCGHLSEFTPEPWSGQTVAKTRKAHQVFRPGVELVHVYDFGSTTETKLRVVGTREGVPLSRHPIVLMARNHPPTAACQECGEPAARLCVECLYEHERAGLLCEAHAAEHPHGNYGEPIELYNSPRMGVCGYEGPAEPPY